MMWPRCITLCALTLFCLTAPAVCSEGKWRGVDEAVVERFAGEHGREARSPLFNTGEGDMQLFAFLLAGAVGGFAAGYYWRVLLEGKRKQGNGDDTLK